jgi:hypothetical protein
MADDPRGRSELAAGAARRIFKNRMTAGPVITIAGRALPNAFTEARTHTAVPVLANQN